MGNFCNKVENEQESNGDNFEQQGPLLNLWKVEKFPVTLPAFERESLILLGDNGNIVINEYMMEHIYLEHKVMMHNKPLIDDSIIQQVRAVCMKINTDYSFSGYKRFMNFDGKTQKSLDSTQMAYYRTFMEITQYITHPSRKNLEDRLLGHFYSVMLIIPIILDHIENNNVEIYELLKQITVYHVNMGVKQQDFKIYWTSIVDMLLTENLLQTDQIKPLVIFFMTINNYIVKFLESYCKCAPKHQGFDRYYSKYRKNYRLLKNWFPLVNNIRNELDARDTRSDHVHELNDVSTSSSDESLEALARKDCLLKWFFKENK